MRAGRRSVAGSWAPCTVADRPEGWFDHDGRSVVVRSNVRERKRIPGLANGGRTERCEAARGRWQPVIVRSPRRRSRAGAPKTARPGCTPAIPAAPRWSPAGYAGRFADRGPPAAPKATRGSRQPAVGDEDHTPTSHPPPTRRRVRRERGRIAAGHPPPSTPTGCGRRLRRRRRCPAGRDGAGRSEVPRRPAAGGRHRPGAPAEDA